MARRTEEGRFSPVSEPPGPPHLGDGDGLVFPIICKVFPASPAKNELLPTEAVLHMMVRKARGRICCWMGFGFRVQVLHHSFPRFPGCVSAIKGIQSVLRCWA